MIVYYAPLVVLGYILAAAVAMAAVAFAIGAFIVAHEKHKERMKTPRVHDHMPR